MKVLLNKISEICVFEKENAGTEEVKGSSEENVPKVANGIPLTTNGHVKSE